MVALAYCLGPLAVFALALSFSGSRSTAFAAAAIYSTLSMSAWILPEVRADLGGWFFPRRLQALVYYGEGPHISSLTLLPLAILAVDLALRRRRAPYFFLAALACAAMALTNWFGSVSLALAIGCLLLAKAGGKEPVWRAIAWVVCIGASAYCLAMPWVPPSTIAVELKAQTIEADYLHVYSSLPVRAAAIVAALALLKLAARRLKPHLQFAIFFTFVLTLLTVAAVWWKLDIVPQAARYQLEMEMALALLIAFAGQAVLKNKTAVVAMAVLPLALIQPVRHDRNYARNFLLRSIDITKTVEWQAAQWLNQNWDGGRVTASGSIGFWLTAFSDTPEARRRVRSGESGDERRGRVV